MVDSFWTGGLAIWGFGGGGDLGRWAYFVRGRTSLIYLGLN